MWKLAVVVSMSLLANSSNAGLVSALRLANIGLGIQIPNPPVPEGALFLDPIESTRGNGVFREGPDFQYDPSTGGISIFAPPMLGPADEFGFRNQYSPNSLRIFGNDYLSEFPTIPQLTKYRRGEVEYSSRFGAQVPFDDEDPSFVIDDDNENFSLNFSSASILVNVGFGYGLSGVEVSFSRLLMPDLDAELFEAEDNLILQNSIWPYFPYVEQALPNVYFVVNYSADYGIYRSGAPTSYSLLAVPQQGIFQEGLTSLPEPNTLLLACIAGIGILSLRRV